MLNKSVSGNIKFHNLPDDTCRLLATWIIANLDIQGVFHGDPTMVRSSIFPRRADITDEQVQEYLLAMQEQKLLALYDAKGDAWQYWPGFLGEQIGIRADREATTYPPPPAELAADPWKWVAEHSGGDPARIPQESGKNPAEEKLSKEKLSKENIIEPPANLGSSAYHAIRVLYIELFPDKPQPRLTTKSYITKATTRMQDPYFAENWEKALRRAASGRMCHESGWFDMTFFLANELNWEKCLNGKYDDLKRRGIGSSPPPSGPVERDPEQQRQHDELTALIKRQTGGDP